MWGMVQVAVEFALAERGSTLHARPQHGPRLHLSPFRNRPTTEQERAGEPMDLEASVNTEPVAAPEAKRAAAPATAAAQ